MIARLFHIILAFAVFFSSTGVVLNQHFCKNELKGTALFLLPESCHSKLEKATCPNHVQVMACEHGSDNGCCSNNAEYVKSDNDQKIQIFEIETPTPPVFVWSAVSSFLAVNNQPAVNLQYKTYKPPIVRDDILVLLQTFLI